MKKTLSILGLGLSSVLFLGLAMFILYTGITSHLPSTPPFKVWLPEGAQLEANNKVKAGTFKFFRTVDELKSLAKNINELVVVYPSQTLSERDIDSTPTFNHTVQYWLPRGHGTFYTANQAIPYKSSFFFDSTAQFNKEKGEFIYTASKSWSWIIGLVMVSCFISIIFAAFAKDQLKKSAAK